MWIQQPLSFNKGQSPRCMLTSCSQASLPADWSSFQFLSRASIFRVEHCLLFPRRAVESPKTSDRSRAQQGFGLQLTLRKFGDADVHVLRGSQSPRVSQMEATAHRKEKCGYTMGRGLSKAQGLSSRLDKAHQVTSETTSEVTLKGGRPQRPLIRPHGLQENKIKPNKAKFGLVF